MLGSAPRPTFSKPNARVASPTPVSAKPPKFERPAAALLQIADEQIDEDDAEDADRDVDEKNPAPRPISDDEAAERRPHDRADQRRDADIGHGAHQIGFFHGPQQNETTDRHHQGPAHTLDDAGGDQGGQRIGHAAADRAQCEDDDRRAEHAPRPEPVGCPAADRDEHRKAQQITGDRDVEGERAFVERSRDRRQRGRDDGRIEVLHEHRAGDDQRHQDRARCRIGGGSAAVPAER